MRINWRDYNPLCVCCKKPLCYVESVVSEIKEYGESAISSTIQEYIDAGCKYRIAGYLETVMVHAPEYKKFAEKYSLLT